MSVPVVTTSPASHRRELRQPREHAGEVREREERRVEDVRARPLGVRHAVLQQREPELPQLAGAIGDVRDRHRRPDHQRPVQPVGGDRVRQPELPVAERALHDLEPVRDPVDAREDRRLVARHRRRGREVQHDLRLDPRLGERPDRNLGAPSLRVRDRRVVGVAPDRLVDAVHRPEAAIGEPDLPPRHALAAREPRAMDCLRDRVRVGDPERRVARSEVRDRPPLRDRREQLRCPVLMRHLLIHAWRPFAR